MTSRGLLGGLAGLGEGLQKSAETTSEFIKQKYLADLQARKKVAEREQTLADQEVERTSTVKAFKEVTGEDGNVYNVGVNAYGKPVGEKTLKEVKNATDFQGTGIEAQMLNIVQDASIPDDDPRKKLAAQRLSQPKTVTTPDGTYVMPGYDLSVLGGGGKTGQAGVQIPSPTSNGGALGFTEKQPTEGEKRAGGFLGTMTNAEQQLNSLDGYDPTAPMEALGGLSNVTSSKSKQLYNQAAQNWIRAKLRMESGAAIPPEEMELEYKTYFPIYGDTPEVIQQKRQAREQATIGMKQQAGRSAPSDWTNPYQTQATPADRGSVKKIKWSDY